MKKILRCIALPESLNETLDKLNIKVEDVISIVPFEHTIYVGVGNIKQRNLEVWFKADVQ